MFASMGMSTVSACMGYICVCLEQTLLYLLQNRPDDFERQWTELVLFKEVIQVLLQHLKHQAGVAAVLKALQSTHHIVLICILTAQPGQDLHLGVQEQGSYKTCSVQTIKCKKKNPKENFNK